MTGKMILIAPWGNPQKWRLARYALPEDNEGAESFSSTEYLAKKYNPDATLIIALDTLASGNPENYDAVRKNARSEVEKYLCNLRNTVAAGNIVVAIAPGIIKKGKIEVSGALTDFLHYTLKTLTQKLLEEEASHVIVDLTHGINFMPSLIAKNVTYAAALARVNLALKKALDSHSSNTVQVKVEYYNSDPLTTTPGGDCNRSASNPCSPAGQCDPPELKINNVIVEKPGITHIYSLIDGLLLEAGGSTPGFLKPSGRVRLTSEAGKAFRTINSDEELKNLVEEAILFLKSFRHGLIPEIIQLALEHSQLPDKLRRAIEDIEGGWEQHISVDSSGEKLFVRRALAFEKGYMILLVAYLLVQEIWRVVEEKGATLDAAQAIMKAYESAGSSITSTIQNTEINKIKSALEVSPSNRGEVRLADLLPGPGGSQHTGCRPEDCEVFKRNLIAHGGWHSCIVYLEPSQADVWQARFRLETDKVCTDGRQARGLWNVIRGL